MAAYWIIAELHKLAGHDEVMYSKIMGIGTDVAYPVMNIRGEIVMFYGTNPSGHPLTVIINSLVNSLYMRYAYASLGYDVRTFKKHVALMTYGDDNAMGVSTHVPNFTHTNVQRVLVEIGVVYTMADKESVSVPYINISDVSFLKRKWRYDVEIGAWMAPLEEASIIKSLTMWVPSGSVDKYWYECPTLRNSQLPLKYTMSDRNDYMRLFKTGMARDFCNIRLFLIGSSYRIK